MSEEKHYSFNERWCASERKLFDQNRKCRNILIGIPLLKTFCKMLRVTHAQFCGSHPTLWKRHILRLVRVHEMILALSVVYCIPTLSENRRRLELLIILSYCILMRRYLNVNTMKCTVSFSTLSTFFIYFISLPFVT